MSELAEYKARLVGFRADLVRLEAQLNELDIQREETRKQIEHIKRVIASLSALTGETNNDVSILGFTDAVRAVLRKCFPRTLSATEIRDALTEQGFNLEPYTNPLASIYTILSRLKGQKHIQELFSGTKTVYRWNRQARFRRRRGFGNVPFVAPETTLPEEPKVKPPIPPVPFFERKKK